jgi:small subunit ribosomal protein S10
MIDVSLKRYKREKKYKMKIQLHLKSYHASYLNGFVSNIQQSLNSYSYQQEKQLFLPLKIEKYTTLRSPHADKKARDQFERTTHKRVLTFTILNYSKMNSLYLDRLLLRIQSLALGVNIRITYLSKL